MYSKFGQFIDGKWQQSEKKETYDVISKGVSVLTDKRVVIDNTVRSSEDVTDSIKSKLN